MRVYEINEFGIDKLALAERETPQPKPGKVLIKLHAASINFRDLMVVEGTYNPRMKLPAIPFSDGSGEVVAVGDGVEKWSVGDRVMPIFAQQWFDGESSEEKRRSSLGAGAFWDGVLREYAEFDQEGLVAVPGHLSYEEASTLPCAALTAWNAVVVSGKVKPGESVLTLGTGGVSVFAAQFAKMAGAKVISTSSSNEKIARLTSLGIDDAINYKEREDWDAAALEIVGKPGVDHVIEVGGSGTVQRSLNAVRISGHVALIGALTGAASFDPTSVFMKAVRVQGIFVGSRKMFEDMNKAITVSEMRPVIDRIFDFEDVRSALAYVKSGSHFGKVVVRFQEVNE
jgi:NADPH:quinone reductase-like Zn-dependent oxidoreductase